MRFTIIAMSIALILAIATCIGCQITIDRAVYDIEDISMQAIDRVEAGDNRGGAEQMALLAEHWEQYKPWLEIMTSHEDLHAVTQNYTEASMNLEREHYDDFHKSMALLSEALKHIRDQERLTVSNIL